MGVIVSYDAPEVTNLLFADNSLILMKTNVACLKSILDMYCLASDQLVSMENSCVFFSPSTEGNVTAEVCSTLGIMTEALNDR